MKLINLIQINLIILQYQLLLVLQLNGNYYIWVKDISGRVNKINFLVNPLYVNAYAIYYNPVTGKSCSQSELSSTMEKNDGCMKW